VSKNHEGSLGYQMMKALQGIFRPGTSRHAAKKHHRNIALITSISTMRSMSADAHQFARFIRGSWSEVKLLAEVRPEMAKAYIQSLKDRDVSGGYIGRKCAMIRKLDAACRKNGIFPPDAPPLLPLRSEGGLGGFHSKPKPIPYTEEQAHMIIQNLEIMDPEVAKLLNLMWKTGLRVTEAAYLRAQDIDLENRGIILNEEGNANRTKGGRPRVVEYQVVFSDFFASLINSPDNQLTGHLFSNRRGLPDRARQRVRQACAALNFPCLGTHAFRKAFSVENYHQARSRGADDNQALLATSHQLGHNRINVTRQSYVPRVEREKGTEDGHHGSR
jgi:integrase